MFFPQYQVNYKTNVITRVGFVEVGRLFLYIKYHNEFERTVTNFSFLVQFIAVPFHLYQKFKALYFNAELVPLKQKEMMVCFALLIPSTF